MDLTDLVTRILDQQVEIFDLLGFDERPQPGPPAPAATLADLEAWWQTKTGGSLPPSYREFLLRWDGITNFSVSYSLFGARDLMTPEYGALLGETLSAGIGYEFRADLPPVMVGHDPETTTRVFFEFTHERRWPDEPVVLEGDPGDLTIHQSFGLFLESRLEANRYTIAELSGGAAR